MQATGRTAILSKEEEHRERKSRQDVKNRKRETRLSLMQVVAKATDVEVKRAPVSKKGELPHTRWEYHVKSSARRCDDI